MDIFIPYISCKEKQYFFFNWKNPYHLNHKKIKNI